MTTDDPASRPSPASHAAEYEASRTILDDAPDDREALSRLVVAATALGGGAAVLPHAERLEALTSNRPDIALLAATNQFVVGLPDRAVETIRKAIPRMPADLMVQARLLEVQALLKLDRIDDAQRATADMIRLGFGGAAHGVLGQIDLARGDADRAIARLRPLFASAAVGDQSRMSVGYDLARALDKAGEHDEAFTIATEAGRLGSHAFDPAAMEAETEAIIEAFSGDAFPSLPRSTSTDERPVFIVGMPRSGTTLLEQVIDAHPEAIGIGERREFEMAAHLLACRTGRPFPEAIASATPEGLDALARLYLDMIDDLVPRLTDSAPEDSTFRRVVNKTLNLDRLVGLIDRTLPGARVIILRRNPLDNLVSILMNPLSPDANPWTGSVEGIIAARRRFDRLVDHWKATAEIPVLDLAYEDLVSAPESGIRRVLDFLDLPFDERCLAHQSTGRVVMTPSANQVNKPMNTSAIARWRRYEKHLSPAIEAFPDAVDRAPR